MNEAKRERFMRKELMYDPLTGIVYRWGIRIGSRHREGYTEFHFRGKKYLAHRAIWFLQTGDWPEEIDHINGIRSDNRWENLQIVTRSENLFKGKLYINNSSGVRGVFFARDRQLWRAQFGRKILGEFPTKDLAIAARQKAEKDWEDAEARQLAQELRRLHEGQ